MGKLELHFFHGFLGGPEDWTPVIKNLKAESVELISHNLLEDKMKFGSDLNLETWAQFKAKELNSRSSNKVLVGYSLGGRQLMHLPHQCFEKAILLGAHPGLVDGHEERKRWDRNWVNKIETLSVDEWLVEWNSQPIFTADQARPGRAMSREDLCGYLEILTSFSLANQSEKDAELKKFSQKYIWACGERDKKYLSLVERLEQILPLENIYTIEQAGHGVIFENPEAVAKLISEVVKDVS